MLTSFQINNTETSDAFTTQLQSLPFFAESSKMSFSEDKINVLVGPSGSGKSMVLKGLAAVTASYLYGFASNKKTISHPAFHGMLKKSWLDSYPLENWQLNGKIGNTVYFHDGFLPGESCSVVHGIMGGYFGEIDIDPRELDRASSGEAAWWWIKWLEEKVNNTFTVKVPEDATRWRNRNEYDFFARLNDLYHSSEKSLILLDEPDAHLDAKNKLQLWSYLKRLSKEGHQIIVSTHDWLPISQASQFNFIELEPGYVSEVSSLFNTWY